MSLNGVTKLGSITTYWYQWPNARLLFSEAAVVFKKSVLTIFLLTLIPALIIGISNSLLPADPVTFSEPIFTPPTLILFLLAVIVLLAINAFALLKAYSMASFTDDISITIKPLALTVFTKLIASIFLITIIVITTIAVQSLVIVIPITGWLVFAWLSTNAQSPLFSHMWHTVKIALWSALLISPFLVPLETLLLYLWHTVGTLAPAALSQTIKIPFGVTSFFSIIEFNLFNFLNLTILAALFRKTTLLIKQELED